MIGIDGDIHFLELLLETCPRDCISHEEVARSLVVHEIAHGIGFRCAASLEHSAGEVVVVLDDLDALRAQEVFLPLLRIGGHVHTDTEAEGGAHDADREREVARRADLHHVF